MDGVLVSWAVPKGPTLDPKTRRMAVHVEDHPVEYFDFEGVIPRGEYGAGDVIVWDWGTWRQTRDDDPVAAVDAGELHFDLDGEKLHGRFAMFRRGRDGDREQWLLVKKADEHAEAGWDTEAHPTSVRSGRTNDEVAAARDDEWTRDRPTVATWARSHAWPAPDDDELAALDALEGAGPWSFAGEELKLTNLDKVLFPPRDGGPVTTKRDLIRYHAQVAPFLLPYLAGRAVNSNRYPNGADKPGFWHKARPDHAPAFVRGWHYESADAAETQTYPVIDNPAALAWMANFGAIELNPWTSRVDAPREPTWALIDIDPGPSTTFDDVCTTARLYRAALDHLGVAGGPKITGKRGVQIWVPIAPGYTFEQTRRWVEEVSRAVGNTVPDLVSWAWSTKDRGGKMRLDYTQNAINKTLVAPFSARPAPGAPVSLPISWDDLDDPDLAPDRWTVHDVIAHVQSAGDPLAPLVGLRQQLPSLA
jgi:bifunctional non-homologous end joining protein LigD